MYYIKYIIKYCITKENNKSIQYYLKFYNEKFQIFMYIKCKLETRKIFSWRNIR